MKFRGPSSSLHPAREAARIQARKAARSQRGSGAAGGGGASSGVRVMSTTASATTARAMSTMSASTAAQPSTDDWHLHVDEAGRLVATHEPTGTSTVLATPTNGA